MKKLIRQLHLYFGLASGVVVLIVSLTGCLYVYEEELRDWFYAPRLYVSEIPADVPPLGVEQLMRQVSEAYPGERIRQWRMYADEHRQHRVRFESGLWLSVDPYTGTHIGPYAQDWLHTVKEIHVSLGMGEPGKWIIRINILVFLLLLLSGLYLWFPFRKNQRRQAFRIQWRHVGWRRTNYDLHRVGGFYLLLPLLIITLTGMWWSFDAYKETIYYLLGQRPFIKPYAEHTDTAVTPLSYDQAVEQLSQLRLLYPGAEEMHINFPHEGKAFLHIKFFYPSTWYRKESDFWFEAEGLRPVAQHLYENYNRADIYRKANYEFHTGRGLGQAGKLLAFLASLFAASLPVTGFYIWYGRRAKKKSRLHTISGSPRCQGRNKAPRVPGTPVHSVRVATRRPMI